MALGTGAIDWLEIAREYGSNVSNPASITMSAYYSANANLPASGAISAAQFKGTTGLAATLPSSATVTTLNSVGTYGFTYIDFHTANNVIMVTGQPYGGTNTTIQRVVNQTWKVGTAGAVADFKYRCQLISGTYWASGTANNTPENLKTLINFNLKNTAFVIDGVYRIQILANNDGRVLATMNLTSNFTVA